VGPTDGGWLAHLLGFAGVTRLNLYSLIVALQLVGLSCSCSYIVRYAEL
jgi:hypothetical protein